MVIFYVSSNGLLGATNTKIDAELLLTDND